MCIIIYVSFVLMATKCLYVINRSFFCFLYIVFIPIGFRFQVINDHSAAIHCRLLQFCGAVGGFICQCKKTLMYLDLTFITIHLATKKLLRRQRTLSGTLYRIRDNILQFSFKCNYNFCFLEHFLHNALNWKKGHYLRNFTVKLKAV